MKIDDIPGESIVAGYEGSFEIFNIKLDKDRSQGVVSFTLLRSDNTMDLVRRTLINGGGVKTIMVELTEVVADGTTNTYLQYKLNRCFIKSWSTSGNEITEEIAFSYSKIEF